MVRARSTAGRARLIAVFAGVLALASLLLTGCAGTEPASSAPAVDGADDLLAEYGLDGLDVRQIVDKLDAMPIADRPEGLISSITSGGLTLRDRHAHSTDLPLPAELTYVSIAPYQVQTHDCYYHSPTGCIGELRNAPIAVAVTDTATGAELIRERTHTFDNGFVGFWLPSGIEAQVVIDHDGRRATSTVSTAGDDALTCLTTMKLT